MYPQEDWSDSGASPIDIIADVNGLLTIRFETADLCGGRTMSKGMDRKKEGKKKPAKSFEEKRAAKREKRQNRGR